MRINYFLDKINLLLAILCLSFFLSPPVTSIASFLVFVFGIVNYFNNKSQTLVFNKPLKIITALLLFYLLLVISILYSDNIERAVSLILRKTPIVLLPISIYFLRERIDVKFVGKIFVIGCVFSMLFGNIRVISHIFFENEPFSFLFTKYLRLEYIKFLPREIHVPYIALLTNLAISFLLLRVFKNKWITIFLIIYLIVNNVLLSSKISFLILIFQLIMFIRFKFNIKSKLIFLLILPFIIALFSAVVVINKNNYEFSSNSMYGRFSNLLVNKDITRQYTWKSAFLAFQESPVFGVGIGDSIDEMLKYRYEKDWIYKAKVNAHNQYLDVLVQIGLLGLLILILITILITFPLRNSKYMLIILPVFIALITESMLERNLGINIFGFFVGLAIVQIENLAKIKSNN